MITLFSPTRRSRVRRLALTSLTVLMAVTGLAALSTPTAQAGDAGADGKLVAAIYNESEFPLTYVQGWSQYGFSTLPTTVPSQGSTPFGMIGSPVNTSTGNLCDAWSNSYNGWFTYKAVVAGKAEYITIDIFGTRKRPSILGCGTGEVYPELNVYRTSTAPPSTWRHVNGPPPNVVANPAFSYEHNVPYLFDQTIEWTAEGPGQGVPTIVSLGDSTISGEGGRWAGNTNLSDSSRVDAGSTWYWDTTTGEEILGCHRSKSAEVHLGTALQSKNYACSAATTYSYYWDYPQGIRFKPGVDWMCSVDQVGNCIESQSGQLTNLYQYAKHHNVKAVVLAVGANDFDFSGVLQDCMKLYMEAHTLSLTDYPYTCSDKDSFKEAISAETKTKIEQDIWESLRDLVNVMDWAGYDKDDYTVILQNYWSAIPPDSEMRIQDVGLDRMEDGGCPLLLGDPTLLNTVLLPAVNDTVFKAATRYRWEPWWPKLKFLDVTDVLKGHRLCEKRVSLVEDISGFTGKGTSVLAADKLEWVAQARLLVAGSEYTLAEGGHANYWGQLAERNCLRQLYNSITTDPSSNGGRCVPTAGGGVNLKGEPNMTLQPLQAPYKW